MCEYYFAKSDASHNHQRHQHDHNDDSRFSQQRWFDETCQTQPEDTLNIIVSSAHHWKQRKPFSSLELTSSTHCLRSCVFSPSKKKSGREHQNTKQQPHNHTNKHHKNTHQQQTTCDSGWALLSPRRCFFCELAVLLSPPEESCGCHGDSKAMGSKAIGARWEKWRKNHTQIWRKMKGKGGMEVQPTMFDTRWWQLKYFFIFTPKLGEDFQFD